MITKEEIHLARAMGLELEVAEQIAQIADTELRPLIGLDDDFEREARPGILLHIDMETTGGILADLRELLDGTPFMVFYYGETEMNDFFQLAIIRSNDRYDILRLKHTNGLNYGLDTEDIIAKLKEWEQRFTFHILHAGFNSLDLLFEDLPENLQEFLNDEVYPFCYDAGTQHALGEEDLPDELRKYKKLVLWWD
jgi:hypothetical protein